jgi:hypothetical protein
MKKTIAKPAARKSRKRDFFLDIIFNTYRKYRNHRRYVHTDLL